GIVVRQLVERHANARLLAEEEVRRIDSQTEYGAGGRIWVERIGPIDEPHRGTPGENLDAEGASAHQLHDAGVLVVRYFFQVSRHSGSGHQPRGPHEGQLDLDVVNEEIKKVRGRSGLDVLGTDRRIAADRELEGESFVQTRGADCPPMVKLRKESLA